MSVPPHSFLQTVRGRLFLLIAALVLPALAIIGALTWEAYRDQRTLVRAELTNTARAVAGVVDTEVERSLAMLQAFTASHSLRQRMWDALDASARRALPDSKRWLVVVDMQGKVVLNTRLPRGAPLPDLALDSEYVATMRAGQPYVSNLVYGPAAGGEVVHVGLPFLHQDGQLFGLSIVMAPDALRESLDVRRFAPESVLAIVDRAGRIIVRNPHKDEFVGRPAMPDIVKATRETAEGFRDSVTLEGTPVLTAYARARAGWSVAIGMPKAKLFANARRLVLLGVGSALVATLVAVALALWIARAVVQSVDGLAREAERLARGEPAGAEPGELYELEVVSRAMRQMAATKSEAEAQLREARDRLHDYAQELERKVEERTASLRDAVAQMEEFSYTVSHDLRGPLRAMSAYATALLEDHAAALDDEARDYLRRIVRASERMNRLTSDLLIYSRIARTDLHCVPVALEPVLRGTIEHYGELHPRRTDITLVMPLHDVLGHEPSLTQALANLLTNAAKFVPPGVRPQIVVRTERRGDRVRVWVEDNGIGIPAAQRDRLFRIFERAPGALAYDGTGVGLAIVRKIVEKMSGTCGVEANGETGSRFWIELAAAQAAPKREEQERVAVEPVAESVGAT